MSNQEICTDCPNASALNHLYTIAPQHAEAVRRGADSMIDMAVAEAVYLQSEPDAVRQASLNRLTDLIAGNITMANTLKTASDQASTVSCNDRSQFCPRVYYLMHTIQGVITDLKRQSTHE